MNNELKNEIILSELEKFLQNTPDINHGNLSVYLEFRKFEILNTSGVN